jgi:hypothetical protein
MELAILTGRGPERITRIAGNYPLIKDEEVVVYGIRAWDGIEFSDIEVYDCQRIKEFGIKHSVHATIPGWMQTVRQVPGWPLSYQKLY